MLPPLLFVMALNEPLIENAGFEDADVLHGWRLRVHRDDREPVLRADPATFKEGRQALLVEAEAPADVALTQELMLPAGTLWRARAWIRTQDLAARDPTDVAAAVHVQSPTGATLARSESRFGTTDWREAEAVFRVPPEGRARLVLFFVGYGRGTGRVWFDDVRLEPVAAGQPVALQIALARRGPAPIDVKQGGQFIEPLCDLLPSLSAQQVAGDSFEDEPPWNQGYRAAVDRPYRPWYPSGAAHLARYVLDTENPFNGRRSQRIELPVPHARAGISQDGFYTREGVEYRLRLHMRGTGGVRVRAGLHGGGGRVAGPVELGRAGREWAPAEAVLKAERTMENGTLTIELEGPGTLWLDRVYLIGADAVLGIWRPDAVAAIRALNCGIIRWGGSAVEVCGPGLHEYEWRECIGPWDRRTPYPVACWGGLDANFIGVEEFVQLCQHLGVEPLICVRWTGRTPADAAAQVEYFNGGPDTPMGRLRAAHGHRAPYGVKYWQIGNEVGGEAYDASVADFARAMKQVDPAIRTITSFGRPASGDWAASRIDYVSEHHYRCDDLVALQAGFEALRAAARERPGPPVRLAVTEWNTTAGEWGLGRGMLWTLANALACSRYHNLMQRYADVVEIANRSNLADSFCSGIIQTGPGWLYLTPTYYAQQLYTRAAGSTAVEVRATSGPGWPLQEPDVSAVLSADGRTLRIYGVNSMAGPVGVDFVLRDTAAGVQGGRVYVLHDRDGAPTAEVSNTRDDPRRIATAECPAEVRGSAFRHEFAPLSVTLLELDLAD